MVASCPLGRCSVLFLCMSFSMLVGNQGQETVHNLTFQLQASLTGFPDLSGLVPGIDVALDIINDNKSLLPGYRLQYSQPVDAQCGGTLAVRGFIQSVSGPPELFIMGGDCSVVSESVGSLAPFWNLVQISTGSTSPKLSNREEFPTFLRPLASDASIAKGFMALMKKNDWRHFAIISQEAEIFTLTREAMRSEARYQDIEVLESSGFPTDNNPQGAVLDVKKSSGRIIFLNTYPNVALEILCQALALDMVTPEYAWVTHAWFPEDFWKSQHFLNQSLYQPIKNCSDQDLMKIAAQIIVINHYPMLDDNDSPVFIGDLNLAEFHERYEAKRNASFGLGRTDIAMQARFTYDATWLAALALHQVEQKLAGMDPPLTLRDFDYLNGNGTIIKNLFYQVALNTTFDGASGPFKLLDGDRVPELRYQQYRLVNGTLQRVFLGKLNEETGVIEFLPDKLPLFNDGMPVSYIQRQLSLPIFVIYTILALAGIAFSIVCLVFNIVCRKKKLVKLSSPNLNIVFIAGIMMMYLLVILLGIQDEFVRAGAIDIICQLNIWVAVIGFTLFYGSVVAKSFRVYYIFKNLKVLNKDSRKTQTIQEWHVILLIGLAVLFDAVFLLIVTAVPTSRLTFKKTELPRRQGDIPSEIEICSSESNSIWLPVLMAFKAAEVVLSLILVFENRKIKVRELLDNRVIIFSVYTIVLACVAIIPITVLLYTDLDALYGVVGMVIMLTVTVLLCINFLPKMYALKKNPSGEVVLDLSSLVAGMTQQSQPSNQTTSITTIGYVEMDMHKNHSGIIDLKDSSEEIVEDSGL